MAIPKQIEQQMKDVEELERQLQAPQAEQTGDAEPPQPETVAEAEVPPTQPVEAVPVVSEEIWEQKYRTLQSKYDAEVPRLHAQLKDTGHQLQQLQQQLEKLTAAQPPEDQNPTRYVTDADEEIYGADFIDVVRRAAREEIMAEMKSEFAALKRENAELRERVMQTGNQVGEMTFEQRLYKAVPDFDAVNTDKRWIAWLDTFDPILRAPRRVAAEQAYGAGDVEAVAHYVNLYKATLAPADAPNPRQVELEKQVAPSRTSTVAQTTGQSPKVYTSGQVETLFAKVRDLNIKGRYDEAAKLEAELESAYREGRVTA